MIEEAAVLRREHRFDQEPAEYLYRERRRAACPVRRYIRRRAPGWSGSAAAGGSWPAGPASDGEDGGVIRDDAGERQPDPGEGDEEPGYQT